MKKPLYLRLNDFSHSIIEELLLQRVACTKTDVIQQALESYLKQNLTKKEYEAFILKFHIGGGYNA